MTPWRPTTSKEHWNNVVPNNLGIHNVEQRQINVVYFNLNMKERKQRCHFEDWVSLRWAASQQRYEYDYLQKSWVWNLELRSKKSFWATNINF